MLKQSDIPKILKASNILDDRQIEDFSEKVKAEGLKFEDFLLDKKIIAPAILYEAAAKFYQLPFISLKDRRIAKKTLTILPEITARSHQAMVFSEADKTINVATVNPDDLELFDFLAKKTGKEVKLFLASPDDFHESLKLYHENLAAEIKALDGEAAASADQDFDLQNLAEDLPIVKIVDALIDYAINEKASDIHVEPGEDDLGVRYRLDGILRRVMTLPKASQAGIIARIKILAGLKLDEHRLPQDGRFHIKGKDYPVSFRISIIPTIDGEKAVLRLLPDQSEQLHLDDLGLEEKQLEMLARNIKKTSGLILATGPTGSGKTTTLYAMLAALNTPEVNISTIEDPIEYHLPGINQCQVQPKIGFTFAAGMRAFLRQDPNIIMVGEIRDNETADIAINAALTGHLVISTLHTNDALTAIPRLLDMQIPSFLISSTLNLVIAQRLVRKICRNCITSYRLDEATLAELGRQFDLAELQKNLVRHGYLAQQQDLRAILFYKGQGCDLCSHSGFKGRLGIYELLEISDILSELIGKKASREELGQAARRQGMITMLEDGFIKAKNGTTTIEEVLRVIKE